METIQRNVKELARMEIIERSACDYCSQPLKVHKGDGGERFCIALTDINTASVKDTYPLPPMDLGQTAKNQISKQD